MKKVLHHIILSFFLFASVGLNAQPIPVASNAAFARYSFIHPVLNRIFNASGLDPFYQKLAELKRSAHGTVSIVHIGDSHIQADFLSGVVRNGLQDHFGNAGRGLVFPYQLAQSNAPDDINSSSNTSWLFNRVAHPEIMITPGVSGYGLKSNAPIASINLSLQTSAIAGLESFNRLKFFLDTSSANSWLFQDNAGDKPYLLKKENGDSLPYRELVLDQRSTGFTLTTLPSGETKAFYGVSLENSQSGVLYHSIGVNGARYDQYNIAPLFWQQLPALQADLYIISLGTNEAQRASFNESAFRKELDGFLERLKASSPNACILITTAADSYRGRSSNTVLKQLNASLAKYCNERHIPFWDLYSITNGYGSASSWWRRGLMNRDRIHFTAEGYRLQGSLLLQAIAMGYNNYLTSH